MSDRGFGVVALGRFLAVERYRETCLSPSADKPRRPVPQRTRGDVGASDSRTGSRAPAGPRNG
jgi:hypothetical protein